MTTGGLIGKTLRVFWTASIITIAAIGALTPAYLVASYPEKYGVHNIFEIIIFIFSMFFFASCFTAIWMGFILLLVLVYGFLTGKKVKLLTRKKNESC
jgi:hypothetical protein